MSLLRVKLVNNQGVVEALALTLLQMEYIISTNQTTELESSHRLIYSATDNVFCHKKFPLHDLDIIFQVLKN